MSSYYPPPKQNPALVPIKERIATVGGWSDRALFPSAKIRKAAQRRKVFIIETDNRRFAVIAASIFLATKRFNALYP